MTKLLTTHSESETVDLGRAIGAVIDEGTVVGLTGTLGAGKTKLTQGLAYGLGVAEDTVTSPTFTICVPHQGRVPMLHLDAYRINSDEEVDELGLDEVVENGVVLMIEWVERIAHLIPPVDLQIDVQQIEEQTRQWKLTGKSAKGKQLVEDIQTKIVGSES